jgi:hypothetical protein
MSVPAPVHFERADFASTTARPPRRGFPRARPVFFIAGACYVVAAGVKYAVHQPEGPVFLVCAAMFFVVGWMAGPGAAAPLHADELRFSDDGLEVDLAASPPSPRRYPWSAIRVIDDTDIAFVLIPVRGARVMFPKKSFPDGGVEARAFFGAHGVAGGNAPVRAAASVN